eukprot:COSAG01_NODE_29259_length_641_cov_1.887454_2_plen_147_part_00
MVGWCELDQGNTLRWDGHSIDSSTVQYRSMTRSSVPRADSDLKSKYCFCAHMHEMMKYFLFTEIHKQCLNQLSVPSFESSICRRIDRVTIPSESIPLVGLCRAGVVYQAHIAYTSAFSVVHGTVVLDGRRSATECATVGCCGMCDG